MPTSTASKANPPSSLAQAPRAITIAILAMGGEGGGVLADWIVDLAEHSGFCAQTTSVPGVAQRTGSTIYYIELFPEALAQAAGKAPVLALMPVPGELDIVIASELMEAGRAIQRGLVTPDRTTLISSTHRVYSMTEKTAIGDGRVDAGQLLSACSTAAKKFVENDFALIAAENSSVISAALFGALAGTHALPFRREQFEEAIRKGGVGVQGSLDAFAVGFQVATQPPLDHIEQARLAKRQSGPRLQRLADRIQLNFPAASHDILLAGIERLADYQDEGYAAEYLDRLEAVRDLDERHGKGDYALLRETSRYLALWMTYEDAIRVADLKTRRTRFERVKQETRVHGRQLLQINEFLYPRVEEITDILPTGIGRWILKTTWARRLVTRLTERGRVVRTTSLHGFLQLYSISGLRRWRRKSLRFLEEHGRIRAWLAKLSELAREDCALAVEVAELPRVLKGYGDTYVRGRQNFDTLMAVLPKLIERSDSATCLKTLREAALADESGQKLAATLREVTA
jgi:indolepyruvate ferredoxin oxidoreductase, beta subunit